MMTIEINGKPVKAKAGETILTVARRANIDIPTLCFMENLLPSGACRICVVEVEGQRGLVPSCSFQVSEGMKVKTHSARVLKARKTIVELLLASHPQDCLYCSRNGGCELQTLAETLRVRDRRFTGHRTTYKLDVSSPSLVRDPGKCILCGRCVRVCEEIQSVSAIDFIDRGSKSHIGTAFDEGLNVSSCVNCGQCITACPTGALTEKDSVKEVMAALADPSKVVVIQHAPAVSVTVGEEFGFKPGTDVAGIMTAALRRMGFDRVFDTSFTADLTIMEEGSEFVKRLTNKGVIPMMTSCSPGWIKFVEQFYPEFIPNLSTCKSPQQMLGALIKSYFAEKNGIDPKSIYSVSIMPCTAKKFEADRPELGDKGAQDIDAVLTTRELVDMIRLFGLDMQSLSPEQADIPFGDRSSAGKLFGATGGVMEAALRSAHFLITGREMEDLTVKAVRDLDGIKQATVDIDGTKVGVAVVSGLGNARKLLDEIRNGRDDIHFIEVMTCPGGCINGGGQLLNTDQKAVRARLQGLYTIDKESNMRTSHSNPAVQELYKEYLGQPLGEKSHHLLHTKYEKRTPVM